MGNIGALCPLFADRMYNDTFVVPVLCLNAACEISYNRAIGMAVICQHRSGLEYDGPNLKTLALPFRHLVRE